MKKILLAAVFAAAFLILGGASLSAQSKDKSGGGCADNSAPAQNRRQIEEAAKRLGVKL